MSTYKTSEPTHKTAPAKAAKAADQTILDSFASFALIGVAKTLAEGHSKEHIATLAYDLAQALLDERQKRIDAPEPAPVEPAPEEHEDDTAKPKDHKK